MIGRHVILATRQEKAAPIRVESIPGAWFGASEVWSHCADRGLAPPAGGWKIPWDGQAPSGKTMEIDVGVDVFLVLFFVFLFSGSLVPQIGVELKAFYVGVHLFPEVWYPKLGWR